MAGSMEVGLPGSMSRSTMAKQVCRSWLSGHLPDSAHFAPDQCGGIERTIVLAADVENTDPNLRLVIRTVARMVAGRAEN